MTPKQQAALKHLGSLTETGRKSGDPGDYCVYEIGGSENGIQLLQMGVTDADMRNFGILPDWTHIHLRECPVSDAGLKYLANQHALQLLDIGETDVTSLNPLRDCTHLRQLWCDRLTRMTDKKAAALANFRELRFLDLAYTDTGDRTAERLGGLTELKKINLVGTKITDAGLQFIGALPNLEMLGLFRTAITDAGMAHLHAMPRLRVLIVGETGVTKKGKAAIRQKMPDLKIEEHGNVY